MIFFLSDSNTFLISIFWSFNTFLMNLNSMISFCHHWFITISWTSFVIDIKFHLSVIICNDLIFNYCMILLTSWEISHIIVVDLRDYYSFCDATLCEFKFVKRQQIMKKKEMWWKNHSYCIWFSESHMCDYLNSFSFVLCVSSSFDSKHVFES